jgi:hypothetical protein
MIQKGTRLQDSAIERLVEALLLGPQPRDELMKQAGIESVCVFYNNIYYLGAVHQFKTTIHKRRVRLFWLTERPAYRQEKTTDRLPEIMALHAQGIPPKVIAWKLGLQKESKAVSAVIRRRVASGA